MGSQQRPLLKRRRGQNWAHDVTTPQKQESSKCLPQTESGTFICKLALEERHRVLPRGNQASKQQVPGRGRAKRVAPDALSLTSRAKPPPGPAGVTTRDSEELVVSLEGSPEASSSYMCFTPSVALWLQLLVRLRCDLWGAAGVGTPSPSLLMQNGIAEGRNAICHRL